MLGHLRHLILLAGLAVALYAGPARPAPLLTRPILTLDAARTIVAAAEQGPEPAGWPCAGG
jgi:glc operon protein GlcG